MSGPTAVVLLSGGMDSATATAIAKADGLEVIGLTIDYGQRHRKELDAAKSVAIPEGRPPEEIGTGIPPTYVPARNTIFLSYALALAEAVGAKAIYIAANSYDYAGYPDCRPEYYEAFAHVARLGTKRGVEGDPVEIRTPLIRMTKADIVRRGVELGVPWELTWSCYHGRPKACGVCDSCQLRLKGFREAGVRDPIPYERERDRKTNA